MIAAWTAAESLEFPQTGGTPKNKRDPRAGFIFSGALKGFKGALSGFSKTGFYDTHTGWDFLSTVAFTFPCVVNVVPCGLRAGQVIDAPRLVRLGSVGSG